MKLPEYNSFSEKEQHFDYKRIEKASELDLVEDLRKPNWFFRGVHEAKYKNFSSAQREWYTKELGKIFANYTSYMSKIVYAAKHYNKGILFDFLYPFQNEFAMLAFLQHYGTPTPFLDFTHEFDHAMFFSVHNLRHNPSDSDIENYFSIYALEKRDPLFNLRDVINNGINSIQILQESNPDMDPEEIKNIQHQLNNPEFELGRSYQKVFYISDMDSIRPSIRNPFKINFNLNIVAQKGLLVYNPLEKESLEEVFDGVTEAEWFAKNTGETETDRFFYQKIKCIDVHKSLAPILLNRVEANGVKKEYLFPEEELVAQGIYKYLFDK